jgi:hypothetical protein
MKGGARPDRLPSEWCSKAASNRNPPKRLIPLDAGASAVGISALSAQAVATAKGMEDVNA